MIKTRLGKLQTIHLLELTKDLQAQGNTPIKEGHLFKKRGHTDSLMAEQGKNLIFPQNPEE